MASAAATLLLLISLFLRYLPHQILSKAGLSCQMDDGCATGLPPWADAGFSFLVGGMIAGLALFALFAFICQTSCSGRRRGSLLRMADPYSSPVLSKRLRGRVLLVDDPGPQSYTIGFLRPRVVVSTGLLQALDKEEVVAVLSHEEGHVAARDNLVILIAQTVALAFAVVPGVGVAYQRLRRAQEIAADEFARVCVGDGLLVASSLSKFARSLFSPRRLPAAAAGFADDGHVAERIRGLLVDDVVSTPKRYAAAVLISIVLLLAVFSGSALAFTGVTLASQADCAACHGPVSQVGTDSTVHGSCSL